MTDNGIDLQILTDAEETPIVMNKLSVDKNNLYGESKQKIYQLNGDNGKWEQVTTEIGYHVNCFDVDDKTLFVGTNGSGVLRYTIGE